MENVSALTGRAARNRASTKEAINDLMADNPQLSSQARGVPSQTAERKTLATLNGQKVSHLEHWWYV